MNLVQKVLEYVMGMTKHPLRSIPLEKARYIELRLHVRIKSIGHGEQRVLAILSYEFETKVVYIMYQSLLYINRAF